MVTKNRRLLYFGTFPIVPCLADRIQFDRYRSLVHHMDLPPLCTVQWA